MQKKIRTRRKTWKDRRDREQSTSFTETPAEKAIPLGLQHVLAMFVGNLTPILIISGACGIAGEEFGSLQVDLLQNAMLIAGIVTLIQLFAIGPGLVERYRSSWERVPDLSVCLTVWFR